MLLPCRRKARLILFYPQSRGAGRISRYRAGVSSTPRRGKQRRPLRYSTPWSLFNRPRQLADVSCLCLWQVESCFLDRVRSRISESLKRSFLSYGNALYDVARVGRVLLRVAPGETGDDVHAADDLAENCVVTL